jgi:hypothetical protein
VSIYKPDEFNLSGFFLIRIRYEFFGIFQFELEDENQHMESWMIKYESRKELKKEE